MQPVFLTIPGPQRRHKVPGPHFLVFESFVFFVCFLSVKQPCKPTRDTAYEYSSEYSSDRRSGTKQSKRQLREPRN